MSQHIFAAAGNSCNGPHLDSSRSERSMRQSTKTWSDIGLRIALAGGIYPAFLVTCLSLVAASQLWFEGPEFAKLAQSLVLSMITTLAAGFPFLLFSCFLVSTLVAVPLVSIANFMARLVGRQLSPRCLFATGVGLTASLWTLLFYLAIL